MQRPLLWKCSSKIFRQCLIGSSDSLRHDHSPRVTPVSMSAAVPPATNDGTPGSAPSATMGASAPTPPSAPLPPSPPHSSSRSPPLSTLPFSFCGKPSSRRRRMQLQH